jgi:hypothetical protein
MAKIPQTRFPDPPEQYDPRAFAELIRQLEQIVLQLNSSYQQDNKDEVKQKSTKVFNIFNPTFGNNG